MHIERRRRDNPDHDLVVYEAPRYCMNVGKHQDEGRLSVGRQVRTDGSQWLGMNENRETVGIGPELPVCAICHRANGFGTAKEGWKFLPW